jgi:hypothetical protein
MDHAEDYIDALELEIESLKEQLRLAKSALSRRSHV